MRLSGPFKRTCSPSGPICAHTSERIYVSNCNENIELI